MKNIGHVVPHTHWDREWRYPIWQNRGLLVDFMDQLLDILEKRPGYKQFIMDGQSVIFEDYLEVRPENREKLSKFIKDGRITCGPWYTLPDLYPLEGESLVRNLLKGIRVSEGFGNCMKIGYTSFGWGQISQFPQIFAGFGIDFVITAKRVTEKRAPKSEFWWESPDGTKVMTSRLGEGARASFFVTTVVPAKYGMPNDEEYRIEWKDAGMIYHRANAENANIDYLKFDEEPKLYPETIPQNMETCWHNTDASMIDSDRFFPAGCDFSGPIEEIDKILEIGNKAFDDKEFVHSTIQDYVNAFKDKVNKDELITVQGELREGPSAACSGNALSSRLYLKQKNKYVQNLLIHKAEPLSAAVAMMGAPYDTGFFNKAWEYLLKSHPHDSINGVTQDKTADDNLYRLSQAQEISEVIYDRAMSRLISNADLSAYENGDVLLIAYNPLPYPVSDILKVAVDMPTEENAWDFDITDEAGNKMEVQGIEKSNEVVIVQDLNSRPWPFRIDRHIVYVNSGEIPAGGFKVYKVTTARTFERTFICGAEYQKMSCGNEIAQNDNIMENEYLRVEVNTNGTLKITDKENNRTYDGLHYFEETGEAGDYWINSAPNNNRTYNSTGLPASIWLENNGPLAATIGIETKMELPECVEKEYNFFNFSSKRSDKTKIMTIKSLITLKKGSKKLDVKVEVDNNIRDHRLRVMYPTNIKTSYSYAGGLFAVDKRPVMPLDDRSEIYWTDMQTLPHQLFVDVTDEKYGLAFLNNTMTEYELRNDGKYTLALTILKGVRNIICTEKRAIGKFPEQEGGQCLGKRTVEYSIYPHKGNWEDGNVYAEADRSKTGITFMQTAAHNKGSVKPGTSLYAVADEAIALSAFKKSEDRNSYIVRLYNPTSKTVSTELTMYTAMKAAYKTTMNEERIEEMKLKDAHTLPVTLTTNQVLTIEIEA